MRCISGDGDGSLEAVCSKQCGWSTSLNDAEQDEEGNYVVPLDCPGCEEGFTYLPETVSQPENEEVVER
ncbi:hypothetical protein [Halorussus halophilus]|uniref:hypothetical protein n=1 Tax=Halorussus halophilus TaxID=2650975 RepID=UPI001300CF63|nr:hypothetical protein [Halorussus halophilus]